MSDEKKIYPQPKETLRARYLPKEGFYQLLFEVDGRTKIVEPLHEPEFDSNGAYMKSIISNAAKKIECYGITTQDIEHSIIQACRDCNRRPPKISHL